MLHFSALNPKGTVKQDIPVGKVFEPTYVYKLLKLNKYDSAFKVKNWFLRCCIKHVPCSGRKYRMICGISIQGKVDFLD